MKLLFEGWRKFVNEVTVKIEAAKDYICPPATQDLELNTKNRNAAIHSEHIKYGPLNVDEPGDYWEKVAKHWDTTTEAAKKSLCSNCVAFDISPRMLECIPGKTTDKDGELGYCWMHHFKCHSARACYTWAKGGPIVEDNVSHDWQSKNPFTENKRSSLKIYKPVDENSYPLPKAKVDKQINRVISTSTKGNSKTKLSGWSKLKSDYRGSSS